MPANSGGPSSTFMDVKDATITHDPQLAGGS
jgi:hypothetical protein